MERTYLSLVVAVLGIALPSMVLGPLMRYFFGVQLKWLPVVGWGTLDKMIMPGCRRLGKTTVFLA